jgi:hypothetical protein
MIFRRTTSSPSNAGKMLAVISAHARAEAAKSHHDKVKARARQMRIELDMPKSEALEA